MLSKKKSEFPFLTIPDLSDETVVYYDTSGGGPLFLVAGLIVVVGFGAAEIVCTGTVYLILKHLEERKDSFSSLTYKLHKELTMALACQVNSCLLCIPFFV